MKVFQTFWTPVGLATNIFNKDISDITFSLIHLLQSVNETYVSVFLLEDP
jgi:hypothetical protein